MATDSRKLRPSELCRLLNSTPLGAVVTEQQLRNHRTRAGLRIGEGNRIDLVRYVAWLAQARHAPKPRPDCAAKAAFALEEAAQGVAELVSASPDLQGHGQQLTSKQEAVIAALMTEPSIGAAATKAGVSRATVFRWLHLPGFRMAYRQARREVMESAIGRVQVASGQVVDTLVAVARQGRRDGDRVRAAIAIFDRAMQGLSDADVLHGEPLSGNDAPLDTAGIVSLVASRLRQVDQAEIPTAEKSRLTATLADSLLRAIGIDVLDKRLETLQGVLLQRKDQKKK